ncbi:CBASS cGAMP synthase [Oceanospirillum maris]|uniref:CBASS cGAMP synthase n=1 Tax=Oceanospirillum maris TaxID=64977 RepID=UPI000403BDA7|nr:hypothetical protein [Oceanospirillum maris]
MSQKFNASKVFYCPSGSTGRFLNAISIPDTEIKLLEQLRDSVRKEVKKAFKGIRENGLPKELLDLLLGMDYTREDIEEATRLSPKFFTQGSFAYKTLNKPAMTPPQQIDIDDGVYFPMKVVEKSPVVIKNVLFYLVDEILKDLAAKNDWKFKEKDTCAQLEINPGVHMDIPLYAIPEERAQHLEEARLKASHLTMENYAQDSYIDFWDSIALDPNEVYLALRNEKHWTISDPKKIRDWFLNQKKQFGGTIVRVCRYLKAWRDHTWPNGGGPSSICLMVAVAETFNSRLNQNLPDFASDCQALLDVAKNLPFQFADQIMNPAEEGEIMFPRNHSEKDLQEIRAEIVKFAGNIQQALCGANDEREVINLLIQTFGGRLPNLPQYVKRITVAQTVRQQPIQQQQIPAPPPSQRSA